MSCLVGFSALFLNRGAALHLSYTKQLQKVQTLCFEGQVARHGTGLNSCLCLFCSLWRMRKFCQTYTEALLWLQSYRAVLSQQGFSGQQLLAVTIFALRQKNSTSWAYQRASPEKYCWRDDQTFGCTFCELASKASPFCWRLSSLSHIRLFPVELENRLQWKLPVCSSMEIAGTTVTISSPWPGAATPSSG